MTERHSSLLQEMAEGKDGISLIEEAPMTKPKKDSTEPKQNEELELQKKTLKNLPESGEEQRGGGFPITVPTGTVQPTGTIIRGSRYCAR